MIGRWVGRIGYVVGSDRFFWGAIAVMAGIDVVLCAKEGLRHPYLAFFQALLCAYATRKSYLSRGTP